MSIASPLTRPSPNGRRVGIRIVTFEACSGFTHVTARRIAQPPTVTFVTRLQPRHCTTELLVSYRTYRQLSGWNPPPLVIRAVRAHCQSPDLARNERHLLQMRCIATRYPLLGHASVASKENAFPTRELLHNIGGGNHATGRCLAP